MNTRTTLPAAAVHFLTLPIRQQMDLSPNGVYEFDAHGRGGWVPITDHYPTRDTFYGQVVTVHTLNSHGRPASKTGVPLTGDFRLLLASSAQYLRGIYVIHDHDTITRIDLPSGRTLTGNGRNEPWRHSLPCECAWCVEQRERQQLSVTK